MDLFNGGVEAVVTDNAVASEYVKNNPDKKIKTIADPEHFESEFYGLMFPKGSDLKPKVDEVTRFFTDHNSKKLVFAMLLPSANKKESFPRISGRLNRTTHLLCQPFTNARI